MMEIKNRNLVERIDSGIDLPIEKESDSFDKVGFIPLNQLHFKGMMYCPLSSFSICTPFFE